MLHTVHYNADNDNDVYLHVARGFRQVKAHDGHVSCPKSEDSHIMELSNSFRLPRYYGYKRKCGAS